MPVDADFRFVQRDARGRLLAADMAHLREGWGAVSSPPTTLPASCTISTATRPAPSSNFSLAGGLAALVASTKAVPTLGWPANGISLVTVKIRTCASLPASRGGNTKVVSE